MTQLLRNSLGLVIVVDIVFSPRLSLRLFDLTWVYAFNGSFHCFHLALPANQLNSVISHSMFASRLKDAHNQTPLPPLILSEPYSPILLHSVLFISCLFSLYHLLWVIDQSAVVLSGLYFLSIIVCVCMLSISLRCVSLFPYHIPLFFYYFVVERFMHRTFSTFVLSLFLPFQFRMRPPRWGEDGS